MIRHWTTCSALAVLLVVHVAASPLDWTMMSRDDDPPSPHTPSQREGHSAVGVDDQVYVFGGCDMDGKCYGDMHIFDSNTKSWSKVPATGDAPSARKGHSALLVRDYIILFGGNNNDGSFNDVYKFDLATNRWILGASINSVIPEARGGHAAATDGTGKVYIFGGYNQDGSYLNDLWILDTNVNEGFIDEDSFKIIFSKPVTSGSLPSSRESCSLTFVRERLYLFGGYGPTGLKDHDLWVYDLGDQKWFQPEAVDLVYPSRREGHAAARNGGNVIIVGGCDVTRNVLHCYNDVWSLDTKGLRWNLLSDGDEQFTPRESHTATFITGGRMIIFGGAKLSTRAFKDVIKLSGFDACPGVPEHCSGHGSCFEDSYCRCADGWTSHDCGERLTCPFDCNGKGSCIKGKCSCSSGYIGPSCFTLIPCPGGCSNHGVCQPDRTCQCYLGYHGNSCEYGSAQPLETTTPEVKAPPPPPPSIRAPKPTPAIIPSVQRIIPLAPHNIEKSGMNSQQQGIVGVQSRSVEQLSQSVPVPPTAGSPKSGPPEIPLYLKLITLVISTISGTATICGMLYVNRKRKEAAFRGY